MEEQNCLCYILRKCFGFYRRDLFAVVLTDFCSSIGDFAPAP